jgi:hypothetical protein
MDDDIKALAEKIVGIVKDRTGGFIEANADAKAFLQERAERLARLLLRLGRADASEVEGIRRDIAFVQQSVENELSTVAIHAAMEARSVFRDVLMTVFDFGVKALPMLLSLL